MKIVKGDNFEIKQVEPNQATMSKYNGFLTIVSNDAALMELALLEKKKETANEEQLKEIEERMIECSKESAGQIENISNAYLCLVLGTLKGSFLEKGYFRVSGKDQEITDELIADLPSKLFETLKANAIELITYDNKAIEKN